MRARKHASTVELGGDAASRVASGEMPAAKPTRVAHRRLKEEEEPEEPIDVFDMAA